MPKTSIILPSYNHANFICESIESALNQTYTDFELIIWDDASSDNSWELIQNYSDPRIKAYRNEKNYGGVFGVNKAISEVAQGEYIAIHHSDDVWALDKLEKQVDMLDKMGGIVACFSNVEFIGSSGRVCGIDNPYNNIFHQHNRSRADWFIRLLTIGNCLCHPSVLIRKSAYFVSGLYNPLLAQLPDYDLWLRILSKNNIYVLPDKLVKFRLNESNENQSSQTFLNNSRLNNELYLVCNSAIELVSYESMCEYLGADFIVDEYECVNKFLFYKKIFSLTSCQQLKAALLMRMYNILSLKSNAMYFEKNHGFDWKEFVAIHSAEDISLRPTADMLLARLATTEL